MTDTREWARQLSTAMREAGVTQQVDAAAIMGVGPVSVNRWLLGKAVPKNANRRRELLQALRAHRPSADPLATGPQLSVVAPPSPLTFANDGEKIAYSLGVLHMAQAAKAELGRCLDAATGALLAPVSSRPVDATMPTAGEIADIRATTDARAGARRPRPTRAK